MLRFLLLLIPCISHAEVVIKSEKVSMKNFKDSYTTSGVVESQTSFQGTAQFPGQVDFVTSAQFLKKGEIIITLDSEIAEQGLKEANALVNFLESKYQNDKVLFEQKFISERDILKSESDFESAKAKQKAMFEKYEHMIIKAPFDGNLGAILYKKGDIVKAGDNLFTIIGSGETKIKFSLPERFYDKVSNGDKVTIENISGKKLSGEIINKSHYLKQTNGNFDVSARLDKSSDIIHGSVVKVDFDFNARSFIGIPERSLQYDEKGAFVYKIKDAKATKNYVEVENISNGVAPVKSGLSEGDIIITEGFTKINDGTTVSE